MDFATGRALREIDDAADMYRRFVQITTDASEDRDVGGETLTVREAMDVMLKWFCLRFGYRFTPDDMYDYYPADCILRDISSSIIAVQAQTTGVLSEFPANPAAEKTKARG